MDVLKQIAAAVFSEEAIIVICVAFIIYAIPTILIELWQIYRGHKKPRKLRDLRTVLFEPVDHFQSTTLRRLRPKPLRRKQ